MSTHSSTFEDADYGCGSASQITAEFTLAPTAISHSPDDPAVALVTFSYTNKLTLSDVKYSTTTDQDVSAWLVYTSSQAPLGSTDKTFVPREDCATTANELTGTVDIPITNDTMVKFGGRWSGFDDNPDGLSIPTLEWFEEELGDNYTITPPQNLQVTFPSTPDGVINASIGAWSNNPNITGEIQEGGKQWQWEVDLINSTGDVLSTKTFANSTLTATLSADTSKMKSNQAYQLRVTVYNEFQASTSVISPVIKSLPPAPIIRRITFHKGEGNKQILSVDWAKPRSGGQFDERVQITVNNYATNIELANVTGGASATGNIEIPNLPPSTKINIILTNTSSAGQGITQQQVYTPTIVPTITTEWSEDRRCLNVSTTSPNVTEFALYAGYFSGDDVFKNSNYAPTMQACDIDYNRGQVLYIQSIPRVNGELLYEQTAGATVPVLHPILGLSKKCDETLNVVDIVESKNGEVTKQWQTGQRVVVRPPCPPSLTPGNYPAGSLGDKAISRLAYIEDGVIVVPKGSYTATASGAATWEVVNITNISAFISSFATIQKGDTISLDFLNPKGIGAMSASGYVQPQYPSMFVQFFIPRTSSRSGSQLSFRLWRPVATPPITATVESLSWNDSRGWINFYASHTITFSEDLRIIFRNLGQ